MRTTTNSVPKTKPATNQGYCASVPLSVYRELAAELQAMQTMMNSISSQNQKLTQENQLLRQEITKAVQSIMQLQKLTEPLASYNQELYTPANFNYEIGQINQPVTEPRPEANRTRNFSGNFPQQQKVSRPRKSSNSSAPKKPFRPEPVSEYFPVSENVYIEEQEVRYYPSRTKETPEANGWVLVIAIMLIIVTAFGAGYLIVRPLLQHRSN
jgi:cobalamin biosynthesis Mg chelatase CobN